MYSIKSKFRVFFAYLILIVIFLPLLSHARLSSNFDYFGKKVGRRYYPNEFYCKINMSKKLPTQYSNTQIKFKSVEKSRSLSELSVNLINESIKHKGYLSKPITMFFLNYQRESLNSGAVKVNTDMTVPTWAKYISIWVFDSYSGNNLYMYIKTKLWQK